MDIGWRSSHQIFNITSTLQLTRGYFDDALRNHGTASHDATWLPLICKRRLVYRTERRDDDNLELAQWSLELDGVLLSACLGRPIRLEGWGAGSWYAQKAWAADMPNTTLDA
jgi:hypothetical protein